MSLMGPQLIETFRKQVDTMVDVYGFYCDLFIIKNYEQQEKLDIYDEKPEVKYENPIKTKVFIEWKPDIKRLRRLGIYTEEVIPLVAWFKFTSIPELKRGSYIRIEYNYIKGEWGTDEFELVDSFVQNSYNAVIVQGWSLAPRRR